eukprot:6254796-Lingulodinium_polyedra.AAC.1
MPKLTTQILTRPCSHYANARSGLDVAGGRLERLFVLACARWNARLTLGALFERIGLSLLAALAHS